MANRQTPEPDDKTPVPHDKVPVPHEKTLAEVEAEIEDARRKSGVDKHDDERRFIDEGTVGTELVDNDIAPPA